MARKSRGKARFFLEDMDDDVLKALHKEAERRSKEGYEWLSKYAEKDDGYNFEYKNPFWHVEYTCKELLGKRAVE